MNKPLPTDFVLLVKNDSHFLLNLLTLLQPNLKWGNVGKRPNEQYAYCNEHIAALFIKGDCLTYLNHLNNQKKYYPLFPRFTGPELLRTFVFGEGQDQEFLTRNNLIQLGPLTPIPWERELTSPEAVYWRRLPESSTANWINNISGTSSHLYLYALPYKHPLILKHVERVLSIDPNLKPEIISPKKPILDDIFQM